MVILHWRPPWPSAAARPAARGNRHSSTSPTTLLCATRPIVGASEVRKASLWSSTSSGSGAQLLPSSPSGFTFSPDIGFFYFYPSFHFHASTELFSSVRLRRRDARYVQRLLKRRLRPFRNFLPSISHPVTKHQAADVPQCVAGPSTIREASNTAYPRTQTHSNPTESAYVPLLHRDAPHVKGPRTTRRIARHGKAVANEGHDLPTDVSSPPQILYTASTRIVGHRSKRLQMCLVYHQAIATLLDRLRSSSDLPLSLNRLRWRYYALLRMIKRHKSFGGYVNSDTKYQISSVLELIATHHMYARDTIHLEDLIFRSEMCGLDAGCEGDPSRCRLIRTAIYNRLLQLYAQSVRLRDASDLVQSMEGRGLRLDSHSYTHLVSLYARLKDPQNAQRVFDEMCQRVDVIPQHAYTSLMNAYAEAGFWDEAIAIFDKLDALPTHDRLKPDQYTCTTLLKCYVLMGAPFEETSTLFTKLQDRGVLLNERSYTLLLQAACEAGLFDIAESIFASWDESPDRHSIDVFAFTVMIRGLLRAGKQEEANEYYREMTKRGIQPTSVTWSVLLQAYASDIEPDTRMILNNLLAEYSNKYPASKRFGENRDQPSKDEGVFRGTAFANVYGPIIAAYARLARPKARKPRPDDGAGSSSTSAGAEEHEAIGLFKQYLAKPGAKPSISIYTALLDMYRRVGDVEGVQNLWSYILDLAVDKVQSLARPPFREVEDWLPNSNSVEVPRSHRNLLCLPLSIYIDAMSARHVHHEVAEAWTRVQQMGFGFDAGNWNHLMVALIRAGELDRAFWTAERLLEAARHVKGNVAGQEHSLQSDGHDATSRETNILSEETVETPMRPPNRAYQYHKATTERNFTYRSLQPLNMAQATSEDRDEFKEPPSGAPVALASADESLANRASMTYAEHQDNLPATPVVGAQLDGRLTAAYPAIRRQHDMHQWRLFSDTIHHLEHELWQLKHGNRNSGDIDLDSESMLQHIQASYPKSLAAIALYRDTMHVVGMRSASNKRR